MSPSSETPGPFEHWRLERDAEDILWLACDRAGEGVNSLSEAVIRELGEIVDWAGREALAGFVVTSAKPASFIVGADIREFDAFERAEDVTAKILDGQAVFARLENLHCPTAAAVEGFCLGGGLELALACDWILARDVPATRLGFPEVKLGIFPGLGGTTRVTERLGGLAGLELALTARMLRAGAAKRLGLVDELVGEFTSLHWAARRAVLRGRRSRGPSRSAALTNNGAARAALGRVLGRRTAAKVSPDHYPAPFSMIDLWMERRGNRRRMFEGEARRVGELMVSDTARNLRRMFFLTERLKALGKGDEHQAVRRVHVVGAGVMGGDIAAWCALQGMEVTLQDRALEHIEPALARARALFRRRLKQKGAVKAATARLSADVDGEGARRADVVIEAIFEDADAKRALYAELEPKLSPGALLATNTSALPLASLASGLAEPGRLVGLHFFNPVAKMPLVEVVHSADTDAARVSRACAFVTAINRFPLPTKSSPGFLVNRVLAPYLMEAFTLLLEGVDQHTIDAAAVRWGMPMGPVELADTVGLEVCRKVAETLFEGRDVEAHARLLDERIARGEVGKKVGKGFYTWTDDASDREPVDVDSPYGDKLGERLLAPFLAECRSASADGVVADDDLLDAGIVFGTGFAPFRGGPMHHLASRDDAATSRNAR